VTCISTLLSSERLESEVLQARDFGLEETQVHEGPATVVLALDILHAGALDVEDRHPPPVHAPHLDAGELAATREPEGPEEEVLGLEHRCLPCHSHALDSRRRVGYRWVGSG
jgi:hypothetical protein